MTIDCSHLYGSIWFKSVFGHWIPLRYHCWCLNHPRFDRVVDFFPLISTCPGRPLTMQEVLDMLDPQRIAKFLHVEVPIRIAERIRWIREIRNWQEIPELVEIEDAHVNVFLVKIYEYIYILYIYIYIYLFEYIWGLWGLDYSLGLVGIRFFDDGRVHMCLCLKSGIIQKY